MTAKIIDGKSLAARIRGVLAREVDSFRQQTGVTPHLSAVLVGDDPASGVYVRNKQRACEKSAIKSTLLRLPAETSQPELLQHVQRLNQDPDIHGILVQLPLPPGIDQTTVLDSVAPEKDVDAFHPENVGRIVQGRPRFLPCTPHGIQQLLIDNQTPTAGAHVVILGRSEIVGKPLALMLMQRGVTADATVTVCHSRTRNLHEITQTADVLVAAIGSPRFVTGDMLQPGVVVIDVGINREGDQLVGDVDFQSVCEVAGAITPVPGGVGPMTIASLLKNTLTAARLSVAAANSQDHR